MDSFIGEVYLTYLTITNNNPQTIPKTEEEEIDFMSPKLILCVYHYSDTKTKQRQYKKKKEKKKKKKIKANTTDEFGCKNLQQNY